ncbi:hypothetical protein LV78_002163 [Actinosynnema pretiosum]|nr:hypothetical protein [Actinosynnema pretiosum]
MPGPPVSAQPPSPDRSWLAARQRSAHRRTAHRRIPRHRCPTAHRPPQAARHRTATIPDVPSRPVPAVCPRLEDARPTTQPVPPLRPRPRRPPSRRPDAWHPDTCTSPGHQPIAQPPATSHVTRPRATSPGHQQAPSHQPAASQSSSHRPVAGLLPDQAGQRAALTTHHRAPNTRGTLRRQPRPRSRFPASPRSHRGPTKTGPPGGARLWFTPPCQPVAKSPVSAPFARPANGPSPPVSASPRGTSAPRPGAAAPGPSRCPSAR